MEEVLSEEISKIPGPPTNVKVVSDSVTSNSFSISWSPPSTNSNAVGHYELLYCEQRNKKKETILIMHYSEILEAEIKGLLPIKEYGIRVRGMRDDRMGEYSQYAVCRTNIGKPECPEILGLFPRKPEVGEMRVKVLPEEKKKMEAMLLVS